jgi:hypothetical protein
MTYDWLVSEEQEGLRSGEKEEAYAPDAQTVFFNSIVRFGPTFPGVAISTHNWTPDPLPILTGTLTEPFQEPQFWDRIKFRRLVSRWRLERGARSSTTEILLAPAYQSIIGMGEKAVPLILAQLRSEGNQPDQWFWALQMLTGADPVQEEDEGNFRRMARAWLDWAAAEGYAG